MTSAVDSLGLIAGNRSLPLVFARQARHQGVKRLVAVAFEGETDPALGPLVDEIVWLRVGQLSKLIATFTERHIRYCVMLGQIAPQRLHDLRPDARALRLLMRLQERNAHTIFSGIAEELARDGVALIEPTPWLRPLMPAAGFRLGPKLSKEQHADVAFGYRVAREIARLDIGQTVVVKRGTVLAVEGFEGTDACLRRGGELAGPAGGAVAVKVAKSDHDFRFDIPCIGPQTVETCGRSQIAVLALETGRTLLLEQETCAQLAHQHRVTVTIVG